MRTLLVDFDGVMHSYKSGWTWRDAADHIPDPPVEGAFEWLEEMVGRFKVCIYSARSRFPGGPEAMREWFANHGLPSHVLNHLEFPTQKPHAFLTIDDRAWRFDGPGTFPKAGEIRAFRPWYKREGQE